uniref:Uncharacterized protein n=1 Tax=Hyaloperonospora arabidopsidis (strain Emoy2) TaxID=559515 RepID=M4C1F6_HYAAE
MPVCTTKLVGDCASAEGANDTEKVTRVDLHRNVIDRMVFDVQYHPCFNRCAPNLPCSFRVKILPPTQVIAVH